MRRSQSEDAMLGGRARNPCRKTREKPKRRYSARKRGWNPCLGERRRRVLENARAEKRRCDPDRAQRRDETKLKGGDRRHDKGPRRRLLITAGADQRNGAFMLSDLCVGVDPFVPTRRDAERKRREKRHAYPARDCSANQRGRQRPHQLALHRFLDSAECSLNARNFLADLFRPLSGVCFFSLEEREVSLNSRRDVALACPGDSVIFCMIATHRSPNRHIDIGRFAHGYRCSTLGPSFTHRVNGTDSICARQCFGRD